MIGNEMEEKKTRNLLKNFSLIRDQVTLQFANKVYMQILWKIIA